MKRFDNLFLLGLTFLLSPLGAFAQVAHADQGTINDRDRNAGARRETARPVRLTVAPNAATPIAMATLPNAICSLHPEGNTTQSVKLFADEEGTVRFHVSPSAAPISVEVNMKPILITIVLWQEGRTTDSGKPAGEAENGPR